MRMFWIAVAVAVFMFGDSAPASGQWYQQRSNAAPAAPPDVRGFSVVTSKRSSTSSSEPARPSEPQQSPPSHHAHQHHQHGGGMSWTVPPWGFWGGGYPVIWSGAFTPGFSVYGPSFPYANSPVAPVAPLPQPAPEEAAKPEIKPTNADTRARAGKFIGYGDALFAKQNYLAAAARYRTAAGVAADMAEPSLRNGFAQVALGNYETAAKSFRRGLSIRSDWSESPFRLRDLYGEGALAKTAHLEALAAAVEANPFDAELITVLAIELYFDGQRERAEMFFVRAAQLGANSDRLLAAFLPHPAPAGAAKPDAKPAPPIPNNKGPAKVVF